MCVYICISIYVYTHTYIYVYESDKVPASEMIITYQGISHVNWCISYRATSAIIEVAWIPKEKAASSWSWGRQCQTGLQKEKILDQSLKGWAGLSRGISDKGNVMCKGTEAWTRTTWNCTIRKLQKAWCGWSIRNEVAGMESESGKAAWGASYLMGKAYSLNYLNAV